VPHINSRKPCYFARVPDGPQTYTLNILWLQNRVQINMSEWSQTSHSQRMWAEVSSSAPHLLQNGLSDSPIRWRNLLKVLYPKRRPVIALDCVLLKDRHINVVPRQGAEINYQARFVVLPKLRQHTQCWLTNQRPILLLISCLDTVKKGSGTKNFTAAPSIASLLAISFLRTPAYPGTQYSFTEWRVLLL
jgi:hypothetical protein